MDQDSDSEPGELWISSAGAARWLVAMCLQSKFCRCTLRLGDVRRGLSSLKELCSGRPKESVKVSDELKQQFCRECGGILESMKQFSEAAQIFEIGGHYEKAASIYIQTRSFSEV